MAKHSSATALPETPHVTNSTKDVNNSTENGTLTKSGTRSTFNTNGTIGDAVKQRAQSLIRDRTIDAKSRAVIRYALETNDPWLAELVRRAGSGEPILDEEGLLQRDQKNFSQTPESHLADTCVESLSHAWERQ